MASPSDQAPPAAPAGSAHHARGADVGISAAASTPTPTSSSRPTSASPPPAHGLARSPTSGFDASSSTSALADYKSTLSLIVSDLAGPGAPDAAGLLPRAAAASPSVNHVAVQTPRHHSSDSIGSNNARQTPHRWAPPPHQTHGASSTPAQVPNVELRPGKPSPAACAIVGFPSPKSEALKTNHKFLDDYDRITSSIQQALPDAARRCVRDNWEKCLIGSDFHQAFVLNASIHHATPAAVQRGIRDFGRNLISSAKAQLIEMMTTRDLDQLADLILSKASVAFFDKTMEQRLKTIDAKRLINALARAERLGYELSDVQEEEDDGPAAAQPRPQPRPQPAPALSTPAAPQPDHVLHCSMCFRRFPAQSAYDHHIKGKVCTRSPSSPGGFRYNCLHCGQGFTTPMGLQYHNANKVCGDFGEPAKASLIRKPSVPVSVPVPVPDPSPGLGSGPGSVPPSRTAVSVPSVPYRGGPTFRSFVPSTPSASKTSSPVPSPAGTPIPAGDPYAHLSPEQLAAMQSELREAEINFGERMRQASLLHDPEKRAKLDGLANSFGTKQSMIRKKYGVRLRNRRTKAEIQQERDRMQYKTAAEMQAEIGVMSKGVGRPVSSSYSAYRPEVRNGTAGRGWAPMNQATTTATTTVASNIPLPASHSNASADVSMHGGKRRLSGGEASDSKRIAYADVGGLNGARAESEKFDPTLPTGGGGVGTGTKNEPMALDDSSSEDGSSSSESGDEDIPAELPASVRQTLLRSSPAGIDARPRPESSPWLGSSSAAAAGI